MFAFLLAWITGENGGQKRPMIVILIAFALASAFGLSIYVAFGFFLIMLVWGIWQIAFERRPYQHCCWAGGIGAAVLLLPYLWELRHGASSMHGGSILGLLSARRFHHGLVASLSSSNSQAATDGWRSTWPSCS